MYKFKINHIAELLSVVTLVIFSGHVYAYEQDTHKAISKEAFKRSVLNNDPNLLLNLGLNENYRDNIFDNSEGEQRNIIDLVMDGAYFEDEFRVKGINEFRFKHHFYDPQNNGRGLDLGVLAPPPFRNNLPSPSWILEDTNIDIPDQAFSYRDANDYLYRALTSSTKEMRDQNWGLVFQSLGHVIHHIQDMAQPQHTRNDAHAPLITSAERQYYEAYTERKRKKYGLPYGGYDTVDIADFDRPRDFWDQGYDTQGIGLAEFSSINFVSAGTNFYRSLYSSENRSHPEFSFPAGIDTYTIDIDISDPSLLGPDQPLRGIIGLVASYVTDSYRPVESRTNNRASTYSIFDYDLTISDDYLTRFTLNRINHDAAHEFLIPRAVAYSAGLINYFFRGRINMLPSQEGWVIQNLSNQDMSGTFRIYYNSNSSSRSEISDTGWNTENYAPTGILAANGEMIVPRFEFPQLYDDEEKGRYVVLVFDGLIGEERGVTTKFVPIRELYSVWRESKIYSGEKVISNIDQQNGVTGAYATYDYSLETITKKTERIDIGDYSGYPSTWDLAAVGQEYQRTLQETTIITKAPNVYTQFYRKSADNYPVRTYVRDSKLFVNLLTGSMEQATNFTNPFSCTPSDVCLIDQGEWDAEGMWTGPYSEVGVYEADFKGVGAQTLHVIDITSIHGTVEPLISISEIPVSLSLNYFFENGDISVYGATPADPIISIIGGTLNVFYMPFVQPYLGVIWQCQSSVTCTIPTSTEGSYSEFQEIVENSEDVFFNIQNYITQ